MSLLQLLRLGGYDRGGLQLFLFLFMHLTGCPSIICICICDTILNALFYTVYYLLPF